MQQVQVREAHATRGHPDQHLTRPRPRPILPASISAAFPRSDIAYVPITGVQAGQIVLAWEAARDSSLIDAFAEAAQQTARPEPI